MASKVSFRPFFQHLNIYFPAHIAPSHTLQVLRIELTINKGKFLIPKYTRQSDQRGLGAVFFIGKKALSEKMEKVLRERKSYRARLLAPRLHRLPH